MFARDGTLLALYKAEDQFRGRMLGLGRAEIFSSASLAIVDERALRAYQHDPGSAVSLGDS